MNLVKVLALLSITLISSIILSCELEPDIAPDEFEVIDLPFNNVLSFNLNGDLIMPGPSLTYIYNQVEKKWETLDDTYPKGLPFGTFTVFGNDLQENYYATEFNGDLKGQFYSQLWILKSGQTTWERFRVPGVDTGTTPSGYTFTQNAKGEIIVQRRVFVNPTTNIIELYKREKDSDTWSLLFTRPDDELRPYAFCNDGTLFFKDIGQGDFTSYKVLRKGTTVFKNEVNELDPDFISLKLDLAHRFIHPDGDVYYMGKGGFYKTASNSEFPAIPVLEISDPSLEYPGDFPGRETEAGYACYRKEMVIRKSDNAIAMRGSCNKYPVTYHSLFKRTSKNNWVGVKSQQGQLGIGSNNKGEVFVSYYGSTKLLKWNF
jgi:hypothetical protein